MDSDNASPESLVGTTLKGTYRVVGRIDEGGMASVYKGLHVSLLKPVAIKTIAPQLAANRDAVARFQREAEITSSLNHPHIVQVSDIGTTPQGDLFLVMELLEGENLHHRLQRMGHLAPLSVLNIVKQVASALKATHGKNIVHRDLKPANIFLLRVEGETDFVKVLDFGVSKVLSSSANLTHRADKIGTPNYMSPEQAKGDIAEIDGRTDQWALACIAWEALCGHRAFEGEDTNSVLYQVVHEAPKPFEPQLSDNRLEIVQVLRRALSKNKMERFPDVDEFVLAFEGAVRGTSTTVPTVLPTRAEMAPEPIAAASDTYGPPPSTLAATAIEVAEVPTRPRMATGKRIAIFVAATLPLVVGALLLFRSATKTLPAVPATTPPPPTAVTHPANAPLPPSLPSPLPAAPEPEAAQPKAEVSAPPAAVLGEEPGPAKAPTKRKRRTRAVEARPAATAPPQELESREEDPERKWRLD